MVSTIVMAEYHQGQPVTDLLSSGNYITQPYNFTHAIRTAELAFSLGGSKREVGERANVKDDLKIIAQAEAENITYLLTDDDNTMFRYCNILYDTGMIKLKPIKLSDGFDATIFNNGQTEINV